MRTIAHPEALAARAQAHPGPAIDPSLRKRLDTCTAHLAWHYGATLTALEADDGRMELVATFGSITRRFRSLPELQGWIAALDAVDAPRPEVARFIGGQERAA
jgi:hypothetical protein